MTFVYRKKVFQKMLVFYKIELFVVRWMDLESVIQNEVSQKEKNKYRMLNTYMEFKKKWF